mgnify:CR=1 FL=1|jgi:hypothetical protein
MKYSLTSEGKKIASLPPGPTKEEAKESLKRIKAVRDWLKINGVSLQFSWKHTSHFQFERNVVVLNARLSTKKKLIILLHEVGHFLVGSKREGERYVYGYASNAIDSRGNRHKLDILDEEFEAWAQGWQIGLTLGVINPQRDRDDWDRVKYEALNLYIDWVKNPSVRTIEGFN